MNRRGISIVALIITTIVMVILTAAVLMVGVNVPNSASVAVFKASVGNVQDAVSIKMVNNMLKYQSMESDNVKWIGVASGYTEANIAVAPNFNERINGVPVVALDNSIKENLSISDEEFVKYYVSQDGTVYHEGMKINGEIYFNQTAKAGIYGIKREIASSDSSWKRIEDSVGLQANATRYGVLSGKNDFDKISPWSEIKSYNYDGEKITAWYGESGYRADGSNGDVLTYVPEFWYKRIQKDGWEYIYITGTDPQDNSYTKSEEFSMGRYEAYVEDGKIYSRSGVIPTVNTSLNDFRDIVEDTNDDYCLMDYRYFTMQMLYLVEYADYNSQAKLGNGFTGMRYHYTSGSPNIPTDKALVAEENTNRIIVSETVGNEYIVGQQISIGKNIGTHDVAPNRTITKKEAYSENGVTGTAIYFDGAAANIAVDYALYNSAQKTGSTDSLGMKSGTPGLEKTSGVIYRGVENIFGNTWTWVDGINISNNEVFVCYDPDKYVSSTFTGDYTKVGTMPSEGGYQGKVGYNANHPLITYPLATGGSSTTHVTDYYYTNSGADRALRVGGSWNDAGTAGLWYWSTNSAPSNTYISVGARLLKYQ